MFVDRIKIFAQAGNGGRGSVSFRREKFVPKGGPDGGDGGRGGDVVLRADRHTDNLSNLFYEPIIKAKNGGHGMGKKMAGRAGADKIVKVPVGTIVYPANQFAIDSLVDLTRDGQVFARNRCSRRRVLARGLGMAARCQANRTESEQLQKLAPTLVDGFGRYGRGRQVMAERSVHDFSDYVH